MLGMLGGLDGRECRRGVASGDEAQIESSVVGQWAVEQVVTTGRLLARWSCIVLFTVCHHLTESIGQIYKRQNDSYAT